MVPVFLDSWNVAMLQHVNWIWMPFVFYDYVKAPNPGWMQFEPQLFLLLLLLLLSSSSSSSSSGVIVADICYCIVPCNI